MPLAARHGALTDIGLHRKTNEDAYVAAPPLFAVCDGMGGAQAGEVASSLAAETLTAGVASGRPLLEAAEQANAAVYARAATDAAHSGMGTTLTAVLVAGSLAHFVHIGDSRAYLLRGGELRQLSDDHSLVGEMIREGRLSEEEAAVHPHRSILSRALGTEPTVRIDEFEVDLLGGDVLLLCSDGLCGVVPGPLIAKHMGRSDPQEAAGRLIAEARKAGGPDNITAVVVRLETPDPGGGPAGDEEVTLAVPAGEEVTLAVPADEEVTLAVPADEALTQAGPAPAAPARGGPGVDFTLVIPAGAAAPADAADVSAEPQPGTAAEPVAEPPAAPARPAAESSDTGDAAPHGDAVDPVPPAPDPVEPARRKRRLGLRWFAAFLVVLVVAGAAGAVTLSTVYYVGVDDGRLAVYSGLPAEVGPVPLHAVYRRSTVEYASLTPAQRQVVDEQALRGRSGALALAAALGMQL